MSTLNKKWLVFSFLLRGGGGGGGLATWRKNQVVSLFILYNFFLFMGGKVEKKLINILDATKFIEA
jgi:hypothetical protein